MSTPLLYPPSQETRIRRFLIHLFLVTLWREMNIITLTLNELSRSYLGFRGHAMAITNPRKPSPLGPTPPEGGTCYHRSGITRSPLLLHPQAKRETAYLSGGFSLTNS
ncbi:hypothetical protein AVEN_46130-1 [Araneus ventricosus]|uniref:Uncharacterized protein n=1 Tax=Araneus ventricosus TaxID=182803 RepID=A0A4Y2D933_ARAVE|nr:hypothetical protein AVEN_46130-1 [Araneus ventricosus]